MRASEFIREDSATNKLMSLLVHQIHRIKQAGGPAEMEMDALIQMAQSVGVQLNSEEDIANLVQTNPNFNNLIADFSADKVILKIPGKDNATIASKADLDVEPVDTVDKMAKRALKKRT
jgi:hypothetical protein